MSGKGEGKEMIVGVSVIDKRGINEGDLGEY